MSETDPESSDQLFQRLSPRELLSRGLAPVNDTAGAPAPVPSNDAGRLTPVPPGMDSVPAQLFPEYRFLGMLNRGGFGAVYRAEHRSLRRPTAIKILSPTLARQLPAVVRFEREIAAVGTLEHPGIVQAFDAGRRGDLWYLAMELVNGVDFGALVRAVGPLVPADACELIRQAALALQHAHARGFIHRDVKPGNLMLATGPDGRPLVKLLDFGLTQLTQHAGQGAELTVSGEVLGTVDYIAPEQIANPRSVDARADVYGLGATLYRLLSGATPHQSDESSSSLYSQLLRITREACPGIAMLCPQLPPGLAPVVDRMLALEPAGRFATAGEVAAALEPFARAGNLRALLARVPRSAPSATPAEPAGAGVPASRRKVFRLAGAAAILAVIAVGLFRFARHTSPTDVDSAPGLAPWPVRLVDPPLAQPRGITLGLDGAFYGGAVNGGAFNHGALYKWVAPTTLVSLVQFTGTNGPAKGRMPGRQLLLAGDGAFYGVSEAGGSRDQGTVFRFDPRSVAGAFTTLHEFDGVSGGSPLAGLVEDRRSPGVFYGGTLRGGRHGYGSLFRIIATNASPRLDVLAHFSGRTGDTPGRRLVSALVQSADGTLYGTTPEGGSADAGTVFKLTVDGRYVLLASFGVTPLRFTNPTGGTTLGLDGNLYGHCHQEPGGYGGIFRVTPDDRVERVAQFSPTLGYRPASTMFREPGGSMVGTTMAGGATGHGTVFRFVPGTGLSKLADFSGPPGETATQPWAMPVPGRDGNLYGATEQGGMGRRGTLYRVTPQGEVTGLVEFVEPPKR